METNFENIFEFIVAFFDGLELNILRLHSRLFR